MRHKSFWNSTYTGLLRLSQYIKGIKPATHVSDEVMEMVPSIVIQVITSYYPNRPTTLPTPIRKVVINLSVGMRIKILLEYQSLK